MKPVLLFCISAITFTRLFAQDSVFYQNIEWSPGGKKIVTEVIFKNNSNLSFQVYILDLQPLAVERKISNAVFPVWSPDGTSVAYSKMTGVNHGSDIWMMNVKTGDSIQLTNVPSRNTGVTFSPDGKKICFSSDRNGGLNLFVMHVNGDSLQQITSDTVKYYNPVWSPVTDEIVYFRERGDGRDKVYMMNLSDRKEIKVTDDTLHDIYPSWLAGGKNILYTTTDPSDTNSISKLVQIDVQGKNRSVIQNTDGAHFSRASPGGKQVAYIKGNWPQTNIYISKSDGSKPECLTCNFILK